MHDVIRWRAVFGTLIALLVSGCINDDGDETSHSEVVDHVHGEIAWFQGDAAPAGARYETGHAFEQVGLLIDTREPVAPALSFRVRDADSEWSSWKPVDITWSEDRLHVGRVLLDTPTREVELRHDGAVEEARLQFYDDVVARPNLLARDLPVEETPRRILDPTLLAGEAPASLVIPRADWGARNPNKVCGSPHDPYRMSIHHTASPADDGGDPAARMRQMQAYHIDSNGWCDIGYHFVVSQSGLIYQGRSTETRTGAHVYNQNTGNIGISLIGNYQANTPQQQQLDPTMAIVGWVHDTYQIPLTRSAVKGHREWPGQSTSCPGNNLLARIDDILTGAENGGAPREAEVAVEFIGVEDVYKEGSSDGIPDVFPGETLQAEITITNGSSGPIRGVQGYYWFESPFLAATSYVIETDHPAYDKTSWMVNDADSAEENPPKDQMGTEGPLTMYAFSGGETKRILIDLQAQQYSIGAADHPDVRGWVKHIDDLYGEQTAWNMDPSNANAYEKLLQDFAQIDILSRDEWQFDGGEAELREGWTACNDIDSLAVDPSAGTLGGTIAGNNPCIISPEWTRIDADTWDRLVLRAGVDTEGESMAIYWARDGETLASERSVVFDLNGDASQPTVVPVGHHDAWSGEVTRLRIDPVESGASEGDTFAIDAIFFQNANGEVASAREELIGAKPVDLSNGEAGDPGDDDDGDDGDNQANFDGEQSEFVVNEGCSSAAASPSLLPLLLFLAAMVFRRRR